MPSRRRQYEDDEPDSDPGAMPPVRIQARTPQGKIGRLTHDTREALNTRLLNNEPAKKILAWLNGLPETVQVCAEYWNGEPVSAKNLSEWKQGNNFAEWMDRRTRAEETKTLMSYATSLVSSGGRIAGGLAAAMAGDMLQAFEQMRREGTTLDDIAKLVEPVVKLAAKENEALKLDGQKEDRAIRRQKLKFDEDKFRKATVQALRKHAMTPEVQAILTSKDTPDIQDGKLEQLIFGDLAGSKY